MKKVCILTSVHPPLDTRIFHRQAKSLLKAGYDVTLIAQHDRDEIVEGIKIVALPRARNRFWRILGTCRVFRLARKQKADIYHFHDPELLPWGWLLQKVSHKPVIYDVHEYYADSIATKYWIPAFLRKLASVIVDKTEKSVAKRLAGVITVNPDMASLFARLNKKTITIYNYPSSEFMNSFNSPRQPQPFTIAYIGSIGKVRGYQVIVEAMRMVKNKEPRAKCIIVGDVDRAGLPDDFLGNEKRLLREGGVELAGKIVYEDVPDFLAKAAVACLPWLPTPNNLKGTPMKLFEYMASGLPVVASDMGLIKGFVEEAQCGRLAEPGNPEAHAAAILHLLQHPDEARKMGENGKRAVRRWYNWENESKKLVAFYEELTR
jgi:glycosyltransferase involved in cell wall biosynthesis